MTASRDPDRLIRAFLDEGPVELPDRVYDAVRSDIDRTRQRVVVVPWRIRDLNSYARLALAAAAVLVAAVVGINLLPMAGSGVGGASPSSSTSASPSPGPSPAFDAFPPRGKLAIGRYSMRTGDVRWSLELATVDWNSHGPDGCPEDCHAGMLTVGGAWTYSPEGAMVSFGEPDLVVGVYEDPCGHVPAPAAGQSPAELADTLTTLPGLNITGPADVTVGGLPAKYVVLGVPGNPDIGRDALECSANSYWLMYGGHPGANDCDRPEGCMRWATSEGSTIYIWILEVDGQRMWIEAETYGSDARAQEVHDIVDSIQFE